MAIPEMVYQTTRILSVLSIAIEVVASIASLYFLFLNRYPEQACPLGNLFSAGTKVRSSALCFLVLLFCIANKQSSIDGLSILTALSDVCRLYASLSVCVLALGILISLVSVFKRIEEGIGSRIWKSALWSMLIGYALSWLFTVE